ncbi:Hint domain-containing protein [Chondromyces crocatus]|uniref:Cell surface protein n=1 Tax=Chondromyces crocatus TaxID=52 RepID=A0A0K1EAC6_CHOCO|nr:Hint domain-containing protein [Chondromyces crocatus]AKT37617.1 cell surface protein [Chondromyces crocatus]
MSTRNGVFLSIALVGTVSSLCSQAHALAEIDRRCEHDSLSPTEARLRIAWARACGLESMSNQEKTTPASSRIIDTLMPSSNNNGTLIEYLEDLTSSNPTGARAYSLFALGYEINSIYVTKLYSFGPIAQTLDGRGFKLWSEDESKERPRPMYPTFGTHTTELEGEALFPRVTKNGPLNCNLYKSNGTVSTTFYINAYCTSSCYTPEQEVLFPDGYKPILTALLERTPEMMTLAPSATLDDVTLSRNKVATYTAELRDSEHIIYEIRTESGGLLRVTNEHPVIQGEGRLVQAQTLRAGDALLDIEGNEDPILSIEVVSHEGKVYNLKPATRDRVSNLLIAQGFLVGSSAYQNDDVGYINRVIMTRSIPEDVLPQ